MGVALLIKKTCQKFYLVPYLLVESAPKKMIRLFLFILFLFNFSLLTAQDVLQAGPMIGYMEPEAALIWIEGQEYLSKASLIYWPKEKAKKEKRIDISIPFEVEPKIAKFELLGLEPETEYEYKILVNGTVAELKVPLIFKTPGIPSPKKNLKEFTFMYGSCMNNPKPILKQMAKVPADFMIWGGDNLYMDKEEYSSEKGIQRRYLYTRRNEHFKELLAVRPNFAIWDDHDYGPNDSDGSFSLKSTSLKTFKLFWGNKTYGEPDNPGIYSTFKWSDTQFFLTDDRYHRSSGIKQDILYGKPNPQRKFFGDKQMKWLQTQLKQSDATFKFIVIGSQALNNIGAKESLRLYSYDFNQLLDFIKTNKIEGVIFLSGDRHFSELISIQPDNCYRLYDFTCSPLTSSVHPIKTEKEKNNPLRIPDSLLMENNVGLLSITGSVGDRSLTIKTLDENADVKWQYVIHQKDLKF